MSKDISDALDEILNEYAIRYHQLLFQPGQSAKWLVERHMEKANKAILNLIQTRETEARIDELEKLDRSSWDAMPLVREISDRLKQLKENK